MPAFVVVVAHAETGHTSYHTCDATVIVGRAEDAQVRLADPFVSRQHIRITAELDGFHVADLGSLNGSIVRGTKVDAAGMRLSWNDTITIGPYVLSFEAPDKATAPAGPKWATGSGLLRVRLDRGRRELLVLGRPVLETLSQHELTLLDLLDNETHAVVSRSAIGDALWGEGQWDVYMLHNVISRLRRRLTAAGVTEEMIITAPGQGYRLA